MMRLRSESSHSYPGRSDRRAFSICIVKESRGDWRAPMKLATTPGAPEYCCPEASEEGNQPVQNGKRLYKKLYR